MRGRKTIWVCGACGTYKPRQEDFTDTSCRTWSVECYASSLVLDSDGRVKKARAVVRLVDTVKAVLRGIMPRNRA